MKKSIKITLIVVGIIVILLGILVLSTKLFLEKQEDNKLTCSFTKTYKVSNLWTVDTKEEIPGVSYIIVKQFQVEDPIVVIIPTKLRDKLQEGKYYEFTYTITGTNNNINTMEDINKYFESVDKYDDFEITVNAKETNKDGLEQIQDNICLLK